MNQDEVLRLLSDRGAVRTGHFLLSSGKHSDVYVEKARVFEEPALTVRLAEEVAGWYEGVELVVSPAVGALPFGFAVALAARARFVYAEREGGSMSLRRGFSIGTGEKALVVEDVVTTGGSAGEVHALMVEAGADAIGVAALVDRSAGDLVFPLRALTRISAETWDPGECPRCAEGVPIESPGSSRLA
ncbi:MAG: orotate phosphoribosyltransferase [Actinomycetota bacterium]